MEKTANTTTRYTEPEYIRHLNQGNTSQTCFKHALSHTSRQVVVNCSGTFMAKGSTLNLIEFDSGVWGSVYGFGLDMLIYSPSQDTI